MPAILHRPGPLITEALRPAPSAVAINWLDAHFAEVNTVRVDVVHGVVQLLDGADVRSYDVLSLRRRVQYVGQVPVAALVEGQDGVADRVVLLVPIRSLHICTLQVSMCHDEASGERAIRIYAADKLANLRDMRSLYANVGEAAAGRFKAPIDVRVRLWRRDAEMVERTLPELGILEAFRSELDAFDAERATTA